MRACLFVGLGGAVGSIFRYFISLFLVNNANGFPFKTLLINILGSFVIGLVAAIAGKHTEISPDMILFLKTGICGGFTTFSTFALESSTLIQSGKIASAVIYIMASIVISIAAVILAQLIVR
ncbi:fluoride efflux transporter CrcB [Peptoniphilus equinus]|uniref:Fluoride-specific ion channel FluC n=1 Tax=Peptoniphilus equinus TaxID=3016343 RepID=A0ABY7QSW2_9FIRM|nr:fluoride efflux transporter CrcB [Peptoniphilus equinus]WBW49827.1 fluoride efflux transporter CrcB [Peptoniphilus equinus]